MRFPVAIGWSLFSLACNDKEGADSDDTNSVPVPGHSDDLDGDGFTVGEADCDDTDPHTYQGAAEREENSWLCMIDADDDGWGSSNPAYGVTAGSDCNDLNSELNHDDVDGDGTGTWTTIVMILIPCSISMTWTAMMPAPAMEIVMMAMRTETCWMPMGIAIPPVTLIAMMLTPIRTRGRPMCFLWIEIAMAWERLP